MVCFQLFVTLSNNCAQVQAGSPTQRQLSGNTHIVSQKKEEKLWMPYAEQSHKIYTEDFILNGVLRQLMDWECEDETSRVEGSA